MLKPSKQYAAYLLILILLIPQPGESQVPRHRSRALHHVQRHGRGNAATKGGGCALGTARNEGVQPAAVFDRGLDWNAARGIRGILILMKLTISKYLMWLILMCRAPFLLMIYRWKVSSIKCCNWWFPSNYQMKSIEVRTCGEDGEGQ